ncbi:MAG: chromosome segregation protein [Candidatus Nanohaloarchaea archaeon]|jgi:chromosome segregation protein
MVEQELEQKSEEENNREAKGKTKINKVTSKGFKSFQRKTAVPFYEGLTAIVGENGSGKSNIIDGMSFVFGRRSSKLRAEKMEQLIFNGGESRSEADFAHVTVYLDNSSGIFDEFLEEDEEAEEVTVGRKITRAGSSMYKFQGTNCKRELIDRLANKAGIDPEGYHFVRQGKVTEIVEQSAVERRQVIDELSGVQEFDEKRDEALDELEEVEDKLQQKEMVLEEKKNLVDKLEEDKELAIKYRELEERKKKLEASILEVRKRALSNQLANINTDVSEQKEEIEELESDLEEIDDKIDEKEGRIDEIDEKQSNSGDNDLQHLENRIEKKKGELENKREKKSDLEDTLENLKKMQNSGGNASRAVKAVLNMDSDKIYGTVEGLISTESRFSTAIQTAGGSRLSSIVVEDKNTAVDAINYLKRKNIGRARTLPLDKLNTKSKSAKSKIAKKKKGVIDYASELIEYNGKYQKAIDNVFSDTLIAEDLDSVKSIDGVRVVTLDGDIMSRGGAMTGGAKKKKSSNKSLSKSLNPEEKKKEIEEIEDDITGLQKDIAELKQMKERKEEEGSTDEDFLEEKRELRDELSDLRDERQDKYSRIQKLKTKIDDVGSKKARFKAELENVKEDEEEYEYDEDELIGLDSSPEDLKKKKKKVLRKQNSMGPVNMRAIEEYKEKKEEYKEFKDTVSEIRQEKLEIEDFIDEVEQQKRDRFMDTLVEIQDNFSRIFEQLFEGGKGKLILEDDNIEKGLKIRAAPPNKEPHIIDALSGGEKTMTAIAFVFAILEYEESPFYIMDEIDAALDKTNSKKLSELLKEYADDNQFIVISHNDITVRHAERAYGVSMRDGVSKMRSIELDA